MKKSLIFDVLALAGIAMMISSCQRDEFSGDLLESKKQAFESVFKSEFGNIDPEQDWGFGSITRGITRANTGDTYPATHEYTDAEGNVIAGANMNHNEWADPDKYFGGWVVPDTLTAGQKLRVQKYFQANPNLSYEDPHFRHFFVQQVYTGGTDAPETGNKEATKAANGGTHAGMTLNQLTVGEACSHINDFNAGTCTTSQVLDNGGNVNDGPYHNDQITLMVNVYDTSCFGYHETSGSNTSSNNNHNDKMALVSAATIDAWAAANGNPGEAVVDKWNRSFMGFDYELLPESDIVLDSYARLDAVPNLNNIPYAWDGTKVMTIGEKPEAPQATPREEVDITATFAQNPTYNNTSCSIDESGNIVCTFNNQYYSNITFVQAGDWSAYDKLVLEFAEPSPIALTLGCNGEAAIAVGATSVEVPVVNYAYNGGGGPSIYGGTGSTEPVTLKIKKVTLVKEATTPVVDTSIVYYNPTYLLGDNDADKISFYSANTNMYGGIVRNVTEDEMKTTQDGKTCLDLTLFKGLVNQGYHPITSDLKTWVKWQAACDGYYSDWIVTLTEAQRKGDDPDPEETTTIILKESGRVFCEDLGQVSNRDMDYNDVVFDAWVYYKQTFTDGVLTSEEPDHTDIRLLAAGGTLALQVAGEEVHSMFDVSTGMMVNTYTEASNVSSSSNCVTGYDPVMFTASTAYTSIKNIPIVVRYSNDQIMELESNKGDAPHKFLVPIGTKWAAERVEISEAYPDFDKWVQNKANTPWGNASDYYLYDSGETATITTIYSWESNGTATETGGTASGSRVNYPNGGNHTLCVFGGKRTFGDGSIQIDFDDALVGGDVITITGYINPDAEKYASLYFGFDNDFNVEDTYTYGDNDNISRGGSISTHTVTVPVGAAGSKVLKITRGGRTQTNVFITKLTVTRNSY